jgi:hypothetical protein
MDQDLRHALGLEVDRDRLEEVPVRLEAPSSASWPRRSSPLGVDAGTVTAKSCRSVDFARRDARFFFGAAAAGAVFFWVGIVFS